MIGLTSSDGVGRASAPSWHESAQVVAEGVGGRGVQSLGLDAALSGGVRPDEVQDDMAHDGEVVGGAEGPHPRLVLVELDVEAPADAVFHLLIAANGSRDALGIGGQAADVVAVPGIGMSPRSAGITVATQRRKAASNSCGPNSASARSKVSCDAVRCGARASSTCATTRASPCTTLRCR